MYTLPYNLATKALSKTILFNNIGDIASESLNYKPYSAKYKTSGLFFKNFVADTVTFLIRDTVRDYLKELDIFKHNIGYYLPYAVGTVVGGLKSYYMGQESALSGAFRTFLYELSNDYKIEPKLGLVDSYGTMILIELIVQNTGIIVTNVFGSKVIKTNFDPYSTFALNIFMAGSMLLYDMSYDMLNYQVSNNNDELSVTGKNNLTLEVHHDEL